MPKAKKLPKYVTVQQHRAALIAMHQGTVAAVMVEMKGMEDRLRAEMEDRLDLRDMAAVEALGETPIPWDAADAVSYIAITTYEGNHPSLDEPPLLRDAGMVQGEDGDWYPASATYEGNHLAPTTAEGAE
jgi:hypothetical protein